MTFKTLTPFFVLPLVPVVAVAFALSTGSASVSASSEENKPIHLTKSCPDYFGNAGDFCTITASSAKRVIPVGSRFRYSQAANVPEGLLDSNVVLDAGNGNRSSGRCTLDIDSQVGLCTFSDGLGIFVGFHARLNVYCFPPDGVICDVNGTYSYDRDKD
jgi:hypothetical protein